MRGVQIRSDARRIARMAEAAEGYKLSQGRATEQAKQRKVLYAERYASSGREVLPAQEDSKQWWHNRRNKATLRHPDYGYEESKVLQWPSSWHKLSQVDSQLATMDSDVNKTSQIRSIARQGPGVCGPTVSSIDVDMCKKLCEHGLISDAVDALDLLLRRRCHVPRNLFYRLLKWCIQHKDLASGRRIHSLTIKGGYEGDAFLATHLIGLYASHGRLKDAMGVFTKIPTPDTYNWATIIFAYARHGEVAEAAEAVRLYRRMCESVTVKPDSCLYSAVLKACAVAKDLVAGKEVHAHILAHFGKPDKFVQAALVNMYAKCGNLEDARSLFDHLPDRNVITWTAMITGYVQHGMCQEALRLYRSMQREGLTSPNRVTYACLLQACAITGAKALDEGKQLHSEIMERGLQEDLVLGGSLVNLYAKCGDLEDARSVFEKLPEKNLVAWNSMLAGYAQGGMGQRALELHSSMRQEGHTPDYFTYVSLLKACASIGVEAFSEGKQLHAQIREAGLEDVLGASLVNMHAKCGDLHDARNMFDQLSRRDLFAWNAMIAVYAQEGQGKDALILYSSMQQVGVTPDSVTYVCLLQACATVGVRALDDGKQLHAQIRRGGLEENAVLGSGLVNMYAKCGTLEEARKVFDKISNRHVVTWTALIAGYVQQGMSQEALSLYRTMRHEALTPDAVTYVCLLKACASEGVAALDEGKQLHARLREGGMREDLVVGSSLVNMYAKCGSLEEARIVFDELPSRDVVTWTTMIAGYAQHGEAQEALMLYSQMQLDGFAPADSVTYLCLLQACADVAALPLGGQLHAEIERREMQSDGRVGAALVNMYAKCGSMYDSQRVFDSLSVKSVEAWSALVSGYARLGDGQVVFDLLDWMNLEGVHPDEVTFLSVLTLCSHLGLVDKGQQYFEMMTENGINVSAEHLICMVDLFGRAGHLDKALKIAKTMTDPSSGIVWRTLLGACRKWKNVEIGQQAFASAVSLDENDAAAYVLMHNIYATAQMWEAATEMQTRRMKLGVWKKPGQSWWTDFSGVVHTFLAGDRKHPEIEHIYARLDQLYPKLTKEGYVPHLEAALLDITDDEKQAELCGHSEKLAIAYALNKTDEGTTIRIVKNLRICEDCHSAIAFISKVEKRTVICRDASRFHVFSEGRCACGDYW